MRIGAVKNGAGTDCRTLYGIIKNNRAASKRYTAAAIRNRFLSRLNEAEKTHACKAELKNICTRYEDDGYLGKIEMRDLLGRHGVKQRNAVILHHVYGLSFNEIAKKHGCSRQAASALGNRGIKKLKKFSRIRLNYKGKEQTVKAADFF